MTSLADWRAVGDGAQREDGFGELFGAIAQIGELAKTGSVDAFPWPTGVLVPSQGFQVTGAIQMAGFDLVCMAGAYVFAHEVRHYILAASGDQPDNPMAEEVECDRWALALMLDGPEGYAVQNGWSPGEVRAKRILGALIAQLAIVALTPRHLWDESDGHPPVHVRVRSVLDAASGEIPPWFWATVSAMLLGFASWSGVEIGEFEVGPDLMPLAHDIASRLRPSS